MNVTERINRVLFILSYVSQNQGISVDELAAKVKMRPRQLLRELEFISLIGKPPFKPDDYVDIYVENHQVFIEFDQELNRPLRFTRPEAMALLMSLELLDPEVDPEGVASLRSKIEEAVSRTLDPSVTGEKRILLERPSRSLSEEFSRLRKAVEESLRTEIEYYSLTRNETAKRVIRPYVLTKHLGYWYVTGYCELREDLRTFKLERILSVKLLGDTFPRPLDFDPERHKQNFLKSMSGHEIEIEFTPPVAPYVRERWGSSVKTRKDETVVLTLYSETLEFPSRIVLENAPHARPLSPPALIEKVREDAREILGLYQARSVAR
ncbi:MAG TPA: WYL domain-containing protein [Acidobacteriota bacterium]|nr:WYL domain-containing protein [Acidobacteriota bacterium]